MHAARKRIPLPGLAALALALVLGLIPGTGLGTARAASPLGDGETAAKLDEIKETLQKLTVLVDRKMEALLHPRWEYKFVSVNILASPPDLAALGAQGWELMFKSADGQFVFKRRVRE